jgi:hypothetical protein
MGETVNFTEFDHILCIQSVKLHLKKHGLTMCCCLYFEGLVISEIGNLNVKTMNRNMLFLKLKGSSPISWSLDKKPNGMTIDERTGLLQWENAMATLTNYTIKVTATNIIGQHTVEWEILVPVSYSVSLNTIEPTGIFPKPTSVDIVGQLHFHGQVPPNNVPIAVK